MASRQSQWHLRLLKSRTNSVRDLRSPGAVATGLAGALLAAGLIVLARNNLGYRGMWWDEAEQFWISRGLSNYSHPFAAPQGLRHVIWSNRLFNLDPGGYSILLFFWSRASQTLARLRGLSFAFFSRRGRAWPCSPGV